MSGRVFCVQFRWFDRQMIRSLIIGAGGGTKARTRLLIPVMNPKHTRGRGGGLRVEGGGWGWWWIMQNRVSATQCALSAGLTSTSGLRACCVKGGGVCNG